MVILDSRVRTYVGRDAPVANPGLSTLLVNMKPMLQLHRTCALRLVSWFQFRACSILYIVLGIGIPMYAQSVPELISVTPNSVPLGWNGTIVVTGSGFSPSNVLALESGALPTVFVNATTLSATIPCCITSYAGQYSLIALPTLSSATGSNPLTFTVGTPPIISSLVPSFATIGGPSVMVTINGSAFAPGAMAYALDENANGGPVSTTFVSSTTLTAVIPASFLAGFAAPEPGGILVHNPDGGRTTEVKFLYNPPAPQISGLSPVSAGAGGSGFNLTVTGSNFYDKGSFITWNGTILNTAYLSPTQLTAAISSPLIASPGTYPIVVQSYNGDYASTVSSASVPFVVSPPLITGISPGSAAAGGPAFTLAVSGGGFSTASVVSWNNTALTTFFGASNELTASVPAALLTTPGNVTVAVVSEGAVRSNNFGFSILSPTISSISPPSTIAGTPGQVLAVGGANFVPGSVVYWNGTPLITTVVNPASLTANVPANLLSTSGAVTITVVNPGGSKSNGISFSVSGPVITTVNPASAAAGTSNLTLMVSGSSFLANSTVLWNGNPLPTVFVSATQLTASVPASLTGAPGTNSITVSNPGGSSSSALIFTLTGAAPLLSALSPPSVSAGGAAFTLTVSGSGFLPGAIVLWNGQPLSTTWISPSQLAALIAAGLISQPGSIVISVSTSAGFSNLLSFSVTPAGPAVPTAGIVNSASGLPPIAPGSLVSIFGTNLATTAASALATPLPQQLAGASVAVNGNPAPLLYAGPAQINFQLPYETPVGTATLMVSSGTGKGSPVSFTVGANAPGVFVVQPSNHAVAVNYADGKLNSPQDPVLPEDYLTIYLTGLGAVHNPVATGATAPDSPLSSALAPVVVSIGGQTANVTFAGLTPGLVGVFQINLVVPAILAGEQPLAVTVGGVSANATFVSVGSSN